MGSLLWRLPQGPHYANREEEEDEHREHSDHRYPVADEFEHGQGPEARDEGKRDDEDDDPHRLSTPPRAAGPRGVGERAA